jgi:cobalt-zinc-cadmium efflux system protein
MGHAHDHDHRSAAGRSRGRLAAVFGLTLLYLAVEVAAGFLTNSLALLADAGHMLTDAAGVGLALFAVWLAGRPPDARRSYGYHRAEILAALANAAILVAASGWILYEAAERIAKPPAVAAGPVVAVAFVGLAVNGLGILLLHSGSGESINVKGAYLEVLSDALSSVGVIAAAAVMWATGWMLLDPLVSVAIGLFILPRTWGLLRQAAHVLLEGTPDGIDPGEVRAAVAALPGVAGVHDLHVWSLTAGVNAASLHVVLAESAALGDVLTEVHECLRHSFPIHHVTVQAEPAGWEEHGTHA